MTPVAMTRVDELREFEACARRVNHADEAQFREFVRNARLVLEMAESDIADALSVSRPTYNRWINGRNMPHPLMRQSIVDRITKLVQARVRVVTSNSRSGSS